MSPPDAFLLRKFEGVEVYHFDGCISRKREAVDSAKNDRHEGDFSGDEHQYKEQPDQNKIENSRDFHYSSCHSINPFPQNYLTTGKFKEAKKPFKGD